MNLLEFAKDTVARMDAIQSGEFAKFYLARKSEYFWKYNPDQLITSSSHGIDFFHNVIKFWDEPEKYREKPKKGEEYYEYNFVLILQKNKSAQ